MSKKSKIILICLAVVIIVAAAVAIPLVLIKFNGNTKLATPTVEVFESENLIVFEASQIENANEYKFIISIPNDDGSSTTVEYSSKVNSLTLDFLGNSSSLKSSFDYAGLYSVQCYVTAEDPNNNSYKSSPIVFERTLQLAAPRLEKQGKNFIWETVNHADSYQIIVSSNYETQIKTVNGVDDVVQSISLSKLKSEFALENDVLYSITIVALSENENYLTSLYSNQLQFYIN